MDRRDFLRTWGGAAFLALPHFGLAAQQSDCGAVTTGLLRGCALRSLKPGMNNCDALVASCGERKFDAAIAKEFSALHEFFGIPGVTMTYFTDCQPNAYAEQDTKRIALGVNLVRTCLNVYKNRNGDFFTMLPIYAILAHEFGHQVQFANGWMNPCDYVVNEELEADMWAGYYVGRKFAIGFEVRQTMQQFYELGTGDFLDPDFHGSPYQRSHAFIDGIMVAEEVSKGKVGKSLAAVRNRFVELVAVELRYPRDASPGVFDKADIRHLCDRYKFTGTYQDCASSMGYAWDGPPIRSTPVGQRDGYTR